MTDKPWWETDVPDDVRRLARACCNAPDQMVLPYIPQQAEQPRGQCAFVQLDDVVPYWTRFINMATFAIQLAREQIHQPELDALWAVKEAYRFYVDVSGQELADYDLSRRDALRKARDLDAALPPERRGDNSRWADSVWSKPAADRGFS